MIGKGKCGGGHLFNQKKEQEMNVCGRQERLWCVCLVCCSFHERNVTKLRTGIYVCECSINNQVARITTRVEAGGGEWNVWVNIGST